MTIERNGEKIQLTSDEIRNAYFTYQATLDQMNIIKALETIDKRGVLEEMLVDENKLLEKYGILDNENVLSSLASESRVIIDIWEDETKLMRYKAILHLVDCLKQLDIAIEKIKSGNSYYCIHTEQCITGEKETNNLVVYDVPHELAIEISNAYANKGIPWTDQLANKEKKVYKDPTPEDLLNIFDVASFRADWQTPKDYHRLFVIPEMRQKAIDAKKQRRNTQSKASR